MLRLQIQGNCAAALPICLDDLVDNDLCLGFPLFICILYGLCIGFFCHQIQTDLLDLQLLADGLNAGQGAVELREHRVNGPAGEHGLGDVVVAGVAVKDLGVVLTAQLEILADAGAAHQLEALGADGLGFLHYVRVQKAVLDVGEQGVLVAGDEDVDVVGVNDVHAHGGGTDLRIPQHHVVEQVGQLEAVYACGDAQAQAGNHHLHRVGTEVGGGLDDVVEHLALGAAGHDAQLLPLLHPGA